MRGWVQSALLGLVLAVLVVSAYTAVEVTRMPRERLSGQSIESLTIEGPVKTERYLGEALEDWRRRHEAAVQAAGGLAQR